MRLISTLILFAVLSAACAPSAFSVPASPTIAASPTYTPIPTLTPLPPSTPTPAPALGTIALDFVALMCNAQWMNGAQHLPCPATATSRAGGYAASIDPSAEGLPPDATVLLTVPAQNNASSIFGRYPSFVVRPGDHFRATLLCQAQAACNVQFALEYFDAAGKYHPQFGTWKYMAGDQLVQVDMDLTVLSGQKVDFTLAVRPQDDHPERDYALWVNPHIYRPAP